MSVITDQTPSDDNNEVKLKALENLQELELYINMLNIIIVFLQCKMRRLIFVIQYD